MLNSQQQPALRTNHCLGFAHIGDGNATVGPQHEVPGHEQAANVYDRVVQARERNGLEPIDGEKVLRRSDSKCTGKW